MAEVTRKGNLADWANYLHAPEEVYLSGSLTSAVSMGGTIDLLPGDYTVHFSGTSGFSMTLYVEQSLDGSNWAVADDYSAADFTNYTLVKIGTLGSRAKVRVRAPSVTSGSMTYRIMQGS